MTQGGSVGKSIGAILMANELTALIYDLRWAIVLCGALIIADLWFGCRSSFADGKEIRRSRAIRRTANKFVDYMMYMLVASMIGMVVEQLGWWQHTNVALCGILLGCFCEIESIIGHWARLHGYPFSLRAFIIKLVRKKNAEVAEFIDEELNNNHERNKRGDNPL